MTNTKSKPPEHPEARLDFYTSFHVQTIETPASCKQYSKMSQIMKDRSLSLKSIGLMLKL